MSMATIPAQPTTVDPAAAWLRATARERRAFREFSRSTGDNARLETCQSWIDGHRAMMDMPAPNETALGHKIAAFLRMADTQFGHGSNDLLAINADLWRMADLELRPADAEQWIDMFGCCHGRWTIGPEGVSFYIELAGCTDIDAMMARRLEAQLHAAPALHEQVIAAILEEKG